MPDITSLTALGVPVELAREVIAQIFSEGKDRRRLEALGLPPYQARELVANIAAGAANTWRLVAFGMTPEVATEIAQLIEENVPGVGGEVVPEEITEGTLISDFENAALWTAGGSGASKAANTAQKQAGAQSVKVTGGPSGPHAFIDFTSNFVLNSAADVITIWYNVDNPAAVGSLNVFLAETDEFLRYGEAQVYPSGSDTPGEHVLTFAGSDLADYGTGFSYPITIRRVRLRFDAPVVAAVSWDSLYLNRKIAKPKIIVGFDDQHESQFCFAYPYMATKGMVGTCYAISGQVGDSDRISLAGLQTLNAAGWDIANHTATHPRANEKSATSICTSQTPGPNLTINGSAASGGVATLDVSRHVVVFSTGNQVGKTTSINGTYQGQPQSETLNHMDWVNAVSQKRFDTVTSISSTITDQITVGTSMSEAELSSELSICSEYLENNGMPRARLHYAAPFGQTNESLFAAMTALGFKTGRIVSGAPLQTALGLYSPYGLPALTPSASTTLNEMKTYVDQAIARGCSAHFCFHAFPVSAVAGTDVSQVNFQAFIDYLETKRDAGLIDVATISQWFDSVEAAA